MSIGPIANIAGGYLQSIIGPALRSAGLTSTTTTSNSTSGAGASQPDNGQLSPFAQVLEYFAAAPADEPVAVWAGHPADCDQLARRGANRASKRQHYGGKRIKHARQRISHPLRRAVSSPTFKTWRRPWAADTIIITHNPLPAIPTVERIPAAPPPPAAPMLPEAPRVARASS